MKLRSAISTLKILIISSSKEDEGPKSSRVLEERIRGDPRIVLRFPLLVSRLSIALRCSSGLETRPIERKIGGFSSGEKSSLPLRDETVPVSPVRVTQCKGLVDVRAFSFIRSAASRTKKRQYRAPVLHCRCIDSGSIRVGAAQSALLRDRQRTRSAEAVEAVVRYATRSRRLRVSWRIIA